MTDRIVENADQIVDEMKRKARRRLVGAIVLALAAAIILPMLLEKEPRPLGDDVSVKIPPVDEGKFINRLTGKSGDTKALPKADEKVGVESCDVAKPKPDSESGRDDADGSAGDRCGARIDRCEEVRCRSRATRALAACEDVDAGATPTQRPPRTAEVLGRERRDAAGGEVRGCRNAALAGGCEARGRESGDDHCRHRATRSRRRFVRRRPTGSSCSSPRSPTTRARTRSPTS